MNDMPYRKPSPIFAAEIREIQKDYVLTSLLFHSAAVPNIDNDAYIRTSPDLPDKLFWK